MKNACGWLMALIWVILLSLVGLATADAASIDFEDFNLSGGQYISIGASVNFLNVSGTGIDVSIVGGTPDMRIYDVFKFGSDPNATGQALIDWPWTTTGSNLNGTQIIFSNPVANFSLRAGDFGRDDDSPLTIQAFDTNGNLIGTDSEPWTRTAFPPFATLSISASGISKIVYLSGGPGANSTFIDDVTFTPEAAPLPGTLILFGTGALALASSGWRRRWRKV